MPHITIPLSVILGAVFDLVANRTLAHTLHGEALYLAAVKASKPSYSLDGIIPAAGMRSANDVLVAFDEELKGTSVDLSRTFDGRFVRKAAGF